ncbi:MAG TPA: Rad52/Rad22 family DNA repair protein, partial [Pyrinomonadaceae bacterium]|nr:Rad52/Rad22 family DNA repair protein [Pyrinomonadaceae bacterium]
MSNTAVATDRKALMRDKRAQGIAAMGLVTREGDRFNVATPSLRGRTAKYEVWRDETGRVRCSCLEFEEAVSQDSTFRCEHILAVKHSLLAKNSEAVTRQSPAAPAASASDAEAVPNKDANASEKRETRKGAKAQAAVQSFEREQNEPAEAKTEIEISAPTSNVRSLAKHTNTEEQEMNKKQDKIAIAQAAGSEELALAAEPVAPIMPLAFTNTLRALKQQVDPNVIKTREGWRDRNGNTHMVEYVEWHAVADILDRVAPTWQHAVRNVVQIGEMVAVTAAITIDGVTREGVGTGTADTEMGIKKAEHDALKRAAVKFGIARELYQRESE